MSSSGGGSVSMEDQTYCLKWNNHQSNLLGLFGRLFSSEQFTDVVVTAEGRSIRAHKVKELTSAIIFTSAHNQRKIDLPARILMQDCLIQIRMS